jgi:hypothetical protein
MNTWQGSAAPPIAVTPPAGWTQATGSPISQSKADPATIGIRIFTKPASGESGDYSFTHASLWTQGMIVALTGANTTTPINPAFTSAVSDLSLNGQTTTCPTLTTATDGTYILWVEAIWDTASATAISGTTPTFTVRMQAVGGYYADGVLTTAGATGSRSRATNGNSGVGLPWIVAMVPVQAAGAVTASAGLVGTGGAGGAYFATNTDSDDRGTIASRKRRRKYLEDRMRRIRDV